MPRNKDPFARDKQAPLLAKHRAAHKPPTEAVDQRRLEVWRLRTDERMTVAQIAKQLSISTSIVYDDLNNQHDQILAALSEYGQFRRKESERELEDFKAHCASYIFDPNDCDSRNQARQWQGAGGRVEQVRGDGESWPAVAERDEHAEQDVGT